MRGVTLIELILVLALVGSSLSLGLPAARRALDRVSVVSAREQLAARIATARSMALSRGGAALVIDEPSRTTWVEAQDLVWDSSALATDPTTEFTLPGGRERARLRFDALGVGRVASQTIRVVRGDQEAALVVSAYGGVSRR